MSDSPATNEFTDSSTRLARLVEQSKPATSFQRHQAELAKREAEVVALVKKREKQQAEKASLEAEVRELKQQIWAEGGYAAAAGKGLVLNEHFLGKEHGYVKGRTIEAPKKRILVLKRKEPGGLCWEETASEEKKKVFNLLYYGYTRTCARRARG